MPSQMSTQKEFQAQNRIKASGTNLIRNGEHQPLAFAYLFTNFTLFTIIYRLNSRYDAQVPAASAHAYAR